MNMWSEVHVSTKLTGFTTLLPLSYCECFSYYSLHWNGIGAEGGAALGEALSVNQTVQTLR